MLFVKNLTKAIQSLDGTLVLPESVGELKTIKDKEGLVKIYGKKILEALEPVGEEEGKKKVKEQKQKVKDADKKHKEKEEKNNEEEEFFS